MEPRVIELLGDDCAIVFREDGDFEAHFPHKDDHGIVEAGSGLWWCVAIASLLGSDNDDLIDKVAENFYHMMAESGR